MKNFIAGFVVALGSFVAGALIINFAGLAPVAATAKDPAVVNWFLHSSYERAVAKNAGEISPPNNLAASEMVLTGARNFAAMCAGCHTAPGAQATAVSAGLNPPPPTAMKLASDLSPSERFWVIKHGVKMTGMPAFGPAHDDDSELWALVAFTEKLPTLNAKSYQQLVTLGKASMPKGDGHAHSHMNEAKPHKDAAAQAHGEVDHHSGMAKPGDIDSREVTEKKPDVDDHSGHPH